MARMKKKLDIGFQIGLLIYFGVAIDKQIHVSLLHAKNKITKCYLVNIHA